MNIKAYLKPSCGWSNGVRAIMRKHGLAFEDIEVEAVDRDGQAANKNFYLDGAMVWPITPLLREAPVHFWIEAL